MTDHDAAHIPVTQDGDTDEVEIALETSRSLWAKGDGRDALRWLRRAAEAAEQAGDDCRQLELARAAADLTALVGPSAIPQPPTFETPSPVSSRPSALAAMPTSEDALLEAESLVPADAFPYALPPQPSAFESLASEPPAPPIGKPEPWPPPVTESPSVSAGSHAMAGGASESDEPSPELQGGLVRVALKHSVRDETLLVVRPLPSGRTPPSGYQVGWLVLGDLSESDILELQELQLRHRREDG